jgi:hypothetical protein
MTRVLLPVGSHKLLFPVLHLLLLALCLQGPALGPILLSLLAQTVNSCLRTPLVVLVLNGAHCLWLVSLALLILQSELSLQEMVLEPTARLLWERMVRFWLLIRLAARALSGTLQLPVTLVVQLRSTLLSVASQEIALLPELTTLLLVTTLVPLRSPDLNLYS